jgi:hypothetical protein
MTMTIPSAVAVDTIKGELCSECSLSLAAWMYPHYRILNNGESNDL